jgi:hypothetical protein
LSGQQRRHRHIITGIIRPPWARGSHLLVIVDDHGEAVTIEVVVSKANKAVVFEANEAVVSEASLLLL